MSPRLRLALGALALVVAASPAAAQTASFSTRVTNNNRVGMTVTNYAFFGNNFQSRAPSLEFPLGSGYEHLVRAGLWVGALAITDTGEVRRVSTGAFDASTSNSGPASTEYLPTSVIVERSKLPNSRFFHPAAVSEQDFVCSYTDDPGRKAPLSVENHLPLGVEVLQQTYSWSFAAFADLVVAHLSFRGTRNLLREVYVGMFAEMASGPKNLYSTWPPSASGGGSLGGWFDKKLLAWDAGRRLIAEHYCQDASNCNAALVPPWVGIKLLGVRPDTIAAKQVGLRIWNYAPGDQSRDEDHERYALLESPWQTPADTLPPIAGGGNDPVEMLTVGPFTVSPSESFDDTTTLEVDFAFCGGDTYEELLEAADFAQLAFDFNYVVPTPPPSPRLHVRALGNRLELLWEGSPESISDPTSPQPGGRDFEGYRIYVGTDREDLRRVAQFDVPDTAGFNTGLESIRLPQPEVIDGDTVHYRYVIDGLRDGFKHFVAVTSYDTGDQQVLSLESGVSQNKTLAVPGAAPGERDGGVTVFPNPYKVQAAWDRGTLVRDHYLWFANLPRRARLAVFTVAGDLVFETDFDGSTYAGQGARGLYDPRRELDVPPPTLSGGSYAWNLISREGQAVASGLYLFSVEDLETGQVHRGKFLVIKADRESF